MAVDKGWAREQRLQTVKNAISSYAFWLARNGEKVDFDAIIEEIADDHDYVVEVNGTVALNVK